MSTPHPSDTTMPAQKLMIVGRRKPGTTLAEHLRHIRHVHGELVLQYIAADPDNAPQRYAQNAVFDGSYRATAPGSDPFALNRDFVTQIWGADLPSLARSTATPFYLEQLKPDEDNFVDQATVVFMPVKERVVLERAAPAAGACKLFGLLQRAPGVAAEAFHEAWRAGAAVLSAALSTGLHVQRHVQNDVLPRPHGPAPLDGIDEFWLADEADARELLSHWQAWVHDTLLRPGLAIQPTVLLAHEQVIYAGPN